MEILGVSIDARLSMDECILQCATSASWKLKSVVRTRRFFSDAELVQLFKTHLLSYIEYRTPAVYHATTTALRPLDRVLQRFLRQLGISDREALLEFSLAPLSVRRDVAMLGLIHRSVLKKGPLHFAKFFVLEKLGPVYKQTRAMDRRHSRTLVDPLRGPHLEIAKRSALGLIAVYNMLPKNVVCNNSLAGFQTALQAMLKQRVEQGDPDWQRLLSPRHDFLSPHPLVKVH